MKGYLKSLALMTGVTAVYFFSGKLGLSLAFVNASATAVWPPTGIALAVLLIWGYRLWPAIFIGAFLVNITTQGSWETTLGIALGNTLEALAAAGLVQKFANGSSCFDRVRMTLRFILFAGVFSTMISATLGVSSLCLGHCADWERCGSIWSTWWIGDMTSNLLIAPLLLIWLTRRLPQWNALRRMEGASLVLTLALVGWIALLGGNPFGTREQLEYLTIPPLLWAAFRFGLHGAIASACMISGIALWGTLHEMGPFQTADPNETLLLLQTFTGIIAITTLVLAAVVAERERFQWRLEVRDAISRILTECSGFEEAGFKILRVLCERAGWDLGVMWQVDRTANKLFCSGMWQSASLKAPEFEAVTRQIRFAPGMGLPGRVWLSGQPAWIPNVARDDNSQRAPAALQAGIHSAFCFPIELGGDIIGLMECLRREIREPDPDFIQMLVPLGHQLGLFVERKAAEAALRASEERYRLVVEDQTEIIYRFAAAGIFTYVNEAYCRFFGKTKEQLLGSNWQPRAAPEDLLEIEERLRTLSPSNRVVVIENRVYNSGGELRWFQFVNRAFFDASGVLVETQSVGRDITGRKLAEASLRDSEQRFKQVTESIQEVFWLTNTEKTETIYISQAYEEIWGRSCASLYASPNDWLTAVHPDDRDRMRAAADATPVNGSLSDEYRIIRPDGSICWIHSRAFPVLDEQGKVYRVAGISEDITLRKRAEFQLALLAHGIETTGELICITDLKDRFIFSNPAFQEALGYTAEELIGKTPGLIHSPNNPPLLLSQILEQSHAGSWSGEVLNRRKNGTEFPIFLRASQIKDHSGKVIALMGVADDITERKRAEKVLIESEARLKLITEQVPATIWTLDQDLKFTSSSGKALASLNLKTDEVVGLSLQEFFGTTDETLPPINAHRHALSGERTTYESSWGGRVWRTSVEPLSDVGGKIIGCIGAAFDVTEARMAEEKLKELADIVQSSRDAIIRLNVERIIVIWNKGAEELFGYPAAEAVGKHISFLLPPDRAGEATAVRSKIDRGELVEIAETVRRCKDGTLRTVSLKVSPMINPDGKLIGSAAIIRDITEKKRLEKMLLEISTNERRRMGHDLHDGLGQHLAGTAFMAKVLEETLAGESSKHAGEAGKLVTLINEGISQTRALAQGLDPVDLEIAGLPAAFQKLAGQTAAQFHLTCDFHCNQERLALESPVGLALFRIAQEGINNATKHGKANHITLELEAGNDQLCLTIRDNGGGFQVEENQVSGMGLRIMRYRASSIGGSLVIHSRINAGTELVCIVPQQTSLI